MEVVLLRFPHIGSQIFDQLDNPLLTKCREVGKSWNSFIDNEKLPWIRMIIKHIKPLVSPWKHFLRKSNVKSVVEIAVSVIQYFREFKSVPENTVPLHFAAMIGNTEIIERLIQIGAKGVGIGKPGKSPSLPEFDNLDPEVFSPKFRYKSALHKRKEKRFELEMENWIPEMEMDSFQCTPLHYAARNGHLTAYQVIMEISRNKNPECGYMTPFHMAAKHGHLSICRLIIDHVEDKNPKNVDDETPLHYAAKGGFLEICMLIIDKVIDKNPQDYSGKTPLHHAANSGNLAIFKYVFNSIKDKNPQDHNGSTPMHLAVKSGNLEILQFIVNNIEDKNPQDFRRITPMHLAAKSDNLEILQLIFNKIEDKHPRDGLAYTPLHFAAERGCLAICKFIIENAEDKNPGKGIYKGVTPLHLAARGGHYDICKLFMENIEERNPTLNPRASIKYGIYNTPFDTAAKNGHMKICGLIQGYLHYEAFFGCERFPARANLCTCTVEPPYLCTDVFGDRYSKWKYLPKRH